MLGEWGIRDGQCREVAFRAEAATGKFSYLRLIYVCVRVFYCSCGIIRYNSTFLPKKRTGTIPHGMND